jgi:lipopolysaccharide assembly outer membrane protein LptD (OstA)
MKPAQLIGWMIATLLWAAAAPAQHTAPQDIAPAQDTPAPGQAAEAAEPQEERATFKVRLDGGVAEGSAGDFEYQEGLYLLATGGVDIKYKNLRVQAERARLDLPTNLLTAEGQVILDEGPRRLTGETLEYDLTTATGKVTQATAYVDPDYYFSGSQIAKIDEDTFTVDDGIFTSCDQDVPSWSIHLSDATITIDEYARIKNARLKFGKVPVLYLPYILWPATTHRASGFLVPKPGYSQRRGASLDLAYYKTLGRSADATFFLEATSKEFLGFGNETRYKPSQKTEGYFRFWAISQPDDLYSTDPEFRPVFEPDRAADELRWKLELFHDSRDLWGKFRGVVNIQQYSDLDYLQDYEREIGRQTRSFIYSNAFLTSNFGQHSFNVMVDERERISTSDDVRRQLPEIEYRLKPTQLGRAPIYLSLDSALHYLSIEQGSAGPNPIDERYGRLHLAPTISIPVSTLPWLSAKLNLGGRATYYTARLEDRFDDNGDPIPDPDGVGNVPVRFEDGTLDRFVSDGGLEIVGPVFSKIFDKKLGRFGKLKHIIEPRTTYRYVDDFDDQQQIFFFDEIDGLTPANGVVFSLFNRLMGKPADPEEGGALEIASLELRQGFSLDDDRPGQVGTRDPMMRTKEGPLQAFLRINPSRDTSFRFDVRYNTLFSELQSASFSGGTKIGPHALGLSWFTQWRVEDVLDAEGMVAIAAGEKTSEQIRVFGKLSILPRRLSLDGEISYDTLTREFRHQRYFLNWTSQCYTWQLELRESLRGTGDNAIKDRDVLFALTLKNVGTFLDLNQSF